MRKKHVLIAGVMMGMVVLTTSCVNQKAVFEKTVSENRVLKDFEEIEINGSPTVYYTQGNKFSVTVKGPESQVNNIITEKDVTSPDLTGIRLNGSGDFISEKRIDTDELDIMLRGSGDIDVKDVICDRCNVELIGSGDIDLDRMDTREMSASLVGSGDIELHLWNTTDTRLALKGSGDIMATFHDHCDAVECELRGSGDITLKGQVSHFSKEKSGSGDVSVGQLSIRP